MAETVVSTNHLTNPSMEAGSGTVEVRRNRALTPNYTGSGVSWESNDGTLYVRTFAAGEGRRAGASAAKFARTATTPNTSIVSAFGVGIIDWVAKTMPACTPGETITVSVYVKANVDYSASVSITFYDASNAQVGSPISQSGFLNLANAWTRLAVTATVPATAVKVTTSNLAVNRQSGNTTGTELAWACDAQYELGSVATPYFDGSVQEVPDADLTQAWTGTVGASESTLTGMAVPGVSSSPASGCAAIRSTLWAKNGSYSVRLIPTSASNNVSYAEVSIPVAARGGGTAIVTGRQSGALSGGLWANRGRPYILNPNQPSPGTTPNAAGELEHRISYSALASVNLLVLPHGGLAGSGDVWYDCAAIFDIAYSKPWYDGDTADVLADGGTYRYYWSGAADASTSYETFEPDIPDPSTYTGYSNADLEIAWLRTVSGITGPASLGDLRFAVYGVSEHAYWAARSGLPVGSLVDHKITAMRIDIGVIDGTLADVSRVFWAKNGL